MFGLKNYLELAMKILINFIFVFLKIRSEAKTNDIFESKHRNLVQNIRRKFVLKTHFITLILANIAWKIQNRSGCLFSEQLDRLVHLSVPTYCCLYCTICNQRLFFLQSEYFLFFFLKISFNLFTDTGISQKESSVLKLIRDIMVFFSRN